MNIVRKTGLALIGAVGFGLLAVTMFTSDDANAVASACTMGGGTQLANVDISAEDPSVCIRKPVPGSVFPGLQSCHQVAKNQLGCFTVYTIEGAPSACTMGGGTQLAQVFRTPENPSICIRTSVPGSVFPGLQACHQVAKNILGCTQVYTYP